jgi:tetratricopeptide (TPR) repeat protein
MRSWAIACLSLALSLISSPSWAVPEAMGPAPAAEAAGQGTANYDAGLKLVETADRAIADADRETDPARRDAAAKIALEAYTQARSTFEQLATADPNMPGAWNMLGYSERKLGNYDAALEAYRRALALRPDYAEAIAYRGEAYLGLNHIAAAKQAYLDLFPLDRKLSEQYLGSMRSWIASRRKTPAGVEASTLDRLEEWIDERAKIAATTAALTRDGASEGWRHSEQP